MLELALHILDIAENSTRAGATLIEITIVEDLHEDVFSLEIRDNGEVIVVNSKFERSIVKVDNVVLKGRDLKLFPPDDRGVRDLVAQLVEERTFG